MPIGSGVTEATCKNLIKTRMCKSGMRWTKDGASNVIALCALVLSDLRFKQFWNRIIKGGTLILNKKKRAVKK
jgi:hypothetical protein